MRHFPLWIGCLMHKTTMDVVARKPKPKAARIHALMFVFVFDGYLVIKQMSMSASAATTTSHASRRQATTALSLGHKT